MKRYHRVGLLVALTIGGDVSPAVRAAEQILVFTNGAESVERPTSEHPIYYVTMIGGYRAEGGGPREEAATVSADAVRQILEKTLTHHHFIRATKETPRPTQLIVFHWGRFTPVAEDRFSDDLARPVTTEHGYRFNNAKQASDLVGGSRVERRWGEGVDSEWEEAFAHAKEPRFFVVLSAYDFDAAMAKPKHVKKLLWRSRMSMPHDDVLSLADCIRPLVVAGGPYFGADMKRAETFEWDRGRVDIGDMRVLGETTLPKSEKK